jgi:hypothetical protein
MVYSFIFNYMFHDWVYKPKVITLTGWFWLFSFIPYM